MFTKKVKPILAGHDASREDGNRIIGTRIEYRFLGLLIYKKTLLTPLAFNIKEDFYIKF